MVHKVSRTGYSAELKSLSTRFGFFWHYFFIITKLILLNNPFGAAIAFAPRHRYPVALPATEIRLWRMRGYEDDPLLGYFSVATHIPSSILQLLLLYWFLSM